MIQTISHNDFIDRLQYHYNNNNVLINLHEVKNVKEYLIRKEVSNILEGKKLDEFILKIAKEGLPDKHIEDKYYSLISINEVGINNFNVYSVYFSKNKDIDVLYRQIITDTTESYLTIKGTERILIRGKYYMYVDEEGNEVYLHLDVLQNIIYVYIYSKEMQNKEVTKIIKKEFKEIEKTLKKD